MTMLLASSANMLANKIAEAHDACEQSMADALEHARNCGDLLIEAKASCQHGEWSVWLTENVNFSGRTARAYMQIARQWDTIQENRQHAANLSVREALSLLAPPAPSLPTIEEVNRVAEARIRIMRCVGLMLNWAESHGEHQVHRLEWLFTRSDLSEMWAGLEPKQRHVFRTFIVNLLNENLDEYIVSNEDLYVGVVVFHAMERRRGKEAIE